MPIKNINNVVHNLDELNNVLNDVSFEPEIRTFGGRHFVNLAKGEDFTLNNIIDCFSKLVVTEPQNKVKIRQINNRIKQLDKWGAIELKNSFILVRLMTWIRHVIGSLFFDRNARLQSVERLLEAPEPPPNVPPRAQNPLPNVNVSPQQQPQPPAPDNVPPRAPNLIPNRSPQPQATQYNFPPRAPDPIPNRSPQPQAVLPRIDEPPVQQTNSRAEAPNPQAFLNDSSSIMDNEDFEDLAIDFSASRPHEPVQQDAAGHFAELALDIIALQLNAPVQQEVAIAENNLEIAPAAQNFLNQLPAYLNTHHQHARMLVSKSDGDVFHLVSSFFAQHPDVLRLFSPRAEAQPDSREFQQLCALAAQHLRNEAAKALASSQRSIERPNTLRIEAPAQQASSNNDDDNDAIAARAALAAAPRPPRGRSHPPAALFDGVVNGASQFPEGIVYNDDEIVREAEYIYTESIELGPNWTVPARLTRDGKWVIQQQGKRACTAGTTAMLIKDNNRSIESLTSDIRNTDSAASDIVNAGLVPIVTKFETEPENKMQILQQALKKNGSAIVGMDGYIGGHVIIVDKITDEGVFIRDPYHGWAIVVAHDAFEKSLSLFDMIQVQIPQMVDSLHEEDFEEVSTDNFSVNLALMAELEMEIGFVKSGADRVLSLTNNPVTDPQEVKRLKEDLLWTVDRACERADKALVALSKRQSMETLNAFEHAITNILKIYNGIKTIQANNGIVDPAFDAAMKAFNVKMRTYYASFDEISSRFIQVPKLAHSQNAAIPNDLASFIKEWCPEVKVEEAQRMIDAGKKLVDKIMRDETESGTKTDLVNFTWFLMFKAVQKKEGFDEGAFVIEGENRKLYNFLLRSEASSTAYHRPSTHFAKRSPTKHHGIDIFDEMMPTQKRTLLFEIAKNEDGSEVLFIKPENFSALISLNTKYDVWMHTWELIAAQRNKLLYPGSDDLANMRKERVPAKILKDFKELLRPFPAIDKAAVLANAKLYGISYMYKYAKTIQTLEAQSFAQALEQEYDHLDKRTGREVFLTAADLNS